MATTVTIPQTRTEFQCPGERLPISPAVHLARLAAYYPACRDCVHRNDTGQIAPATLERIKETELRVPRSSLLTAEGVRGVYLNEITRKKAGEYARGLAAVLWRQFPLQARSEIESGALRPGPTVVVGHDERTSSPDIAVGVVRDLRSMSCRVIDVGRITRPGFWFAVDHMQASAGIHVTGSGCPPVWTGLDFVSQSAIPISGGELLSDIEARSCEPNPRPSRQAGQLRAFHAAIPYEAGLWKHFHALRPLRIVCGCTSRMIRELLSRIMDQLPCELRLVDISDRARNLIDPHDEDIHRVAMVLRSTSSHLGVVIDDDGQTCGFLDERGELITPRAVTRVLANLIRSQQPDAVLAIESSAMTAFPGAIDAGHSLWSMSSAIREQKAALGGGDSGRVWFRESFPTCDAILTVGHVLQALSRSDAEFSQVAGDSGVGREK